MDSNDTRHTPRSLRVRLGLKQLEVASRAGVSDRTYRNLEEGKDVTLDSLRAIAPVLGVTFEALVAAHDVERSRRSDTSRAKPARSRRTAKGAA